MTYTVTQEDREATKRHQHRFLTEGESETQLLWEAFARHRIETLEQVEAIVENCGDMCCGCLDAIRNLKEKSDE